MSKKIIQNYFQIKNDILKLSSTTNFIVVTKNQPVNLIENIIQLGHVHFGENKLQESLSKWLNLKILYPNVKLHFIGPIQTNKVLGIFNIFDYIHSLDSKKLVDAFSTLEIKLKKKLKYFIQINIDNEAQKRGIHISDLANFISYCNSSNLNLIGLMCIPPVNKDPKFFFKILKELADKNFLKDLSMGMSDDYKEALLNGSTWVRVGSKIFSSLS
jgi:pyridoxal phosphate enzyme (YggS family)